MKKESSFKMKGFSGFGGINPAKDVVSFKPKFDPMKTIYSGTPEHKQFMKSAKKAIAKGPKVSKKPTSLATKAFRGFKSLAKGLGSRATGVAGMMIGTMGTALGNTNQGVGFKGEGSARRLFNKRKKK